MSTHDAFLSEMKKLISEHFVSRAEYDRLKEDFVLLENEHLRSKQIFHKKQEEWDSIKKSLASKSPSVADKNMTSSHAAHQENMRIPKAPRSKNKANKRIIFGGDTPPGYWSTRFTPET